MRRTLGLILVLALGAAACGDDDATDPASLDSCEGVADATIDLVQDVIDQMGEMSAADLGALSEGGELPPAFAEIEERGTELGARGAELECANLDTLVADRADQLTADPNNVMGQLIIEGTQGGDDVMGRLFRE